MYFEKCVKKFEKQCLLQYPTFSKFAKKTKFHGTYFLVSSAISNCNPFQNTLAIDCNRTDM